MIVEQGKAKRERQQVKEIIVAASDDQDLKEDLWRNQKCVNVLQL